MLLKLIYSKKDGDENSVSFSINNIQFLNDFIKNELCDEIIVKEARKIVIETSIYYILSNYLPSSISSFKKKSFSACEYSDNDNIRVLASKNITNQVQLYNLECQANQLLFKSNFVPSKLYNISVEQNGIISEIYNNNLKDLNENFHKFYYESNFDYFLNFSTSKYLSIYDKAYNRKFHLCLKDYLPEAIYNLYNFHLNINENYVLFSFERFIFILDLEQNSLLPFLLPEFDLYQEYINRMSDADYELLHQRLSYCLYSLNLTNKFYGYDVKNNFESIIKSLPQREEYLPKFLEIIRAYETLSGDTVNSVEIEGITDTVFWKKRVLRNKLQIFYPEFTQMHRLKSKCQDKITSISSLSNGNIIFGTLMGNIYIIDRNGLCKNIILGNDKSLYINNSIDFLYAVNNKLYVLTSNSVIVLDMSSNFTVLNSVQTIEGRYKWFKEGFVCIKNCYLYIFNQNANFIARVKTPYSIKNVSYDNEKCILLIQSKDVMYSFWINLN